MRFGSTASGLYYLAELVEEYSIIAKKVMHIMIWVSDVDITRLELKTTRVDCHSGSRGRLVV